MALVGPALRLGVKYGARWLAKTAARRGIRSAAGSAARQRLRETARQAARDRVARVVGVGAFGAGVTGVAAGGVYASYKSRTADMFEPSRKRPRVGPTWPSRNKSASAWKAASGTTGLITSSVRQGRRDPNLEKKLVRASERHIIFTIRGLNQWNSETGANRGYQSLMLATPGGVNDVRHYPVHLWNLTAVPQGTSLVDYQCVGNASINPVPGFVLQQAIGTSGQGMLWNEGVLTAITLNGNNSAQPIPSAWSPEQVSDLSSDQTSTATIGAFGRKSFLDWVDLKMMVYGKRKHDTYVTISLVKFREPEYCPEFFKAPNNPSSGGFISNDDVGKEVADYWKGVVTRLCNNPIMRRPQIVKKKVMDVLYKKVIKLGTKQTDEANQDVMVHMFSMFKRFNKLINHTNVDRTNATEDAAAILNEFNIPTSRTDYGPQPNKLTDNIYLMITAYTPHDYGTGNLQAPEYQNYQNSYDIVLRKKCYLDLA